MKKTLLLSVFGFTAIVVAGGKIEFTNSIENSAGTMSSKEFKFDMKKDLKSDHKLVANIKENNFALDAELKAKGSLSGDKYKFDDAIEGFGKIGFDNDSIATSIKYDFNKKETFLNGSYKYTHDKLTLKPNVEFKFDILKPREFTIGNDVEYKFDDNFKVKNEFKFFKSMKNVNDKGKLTPLFQHFNTGIINYYGMNIKASAEYKIDEELKLNTSLIAKYEKSNRTLTDENEAIENIDLKTLEIGTENKIEYNPKLISGLKSDIMFKYIYSRINEKFNVFDINDLEKRHNVEIDANASYKYNIIDNLSVTPAFNLKYKYRLSNYDDSSLNQKAIALYKTHELKLITSTKLSYTIDKLVTSLKLESPVEFLGAYLINGEEYKKSGPAGRLPENVQDFKFNKLGLKTTLSLEYKW